MTHTHNVNVFVHIIFFLINIYLSVPRGWSWFSGEVMWAPLAFASNLNKSSKITSRWQLKRNVIWGKLWKSVIPNYACLNL